MMDLTQKQWVSHVVFHPFEGYEDLRWKKGGSLKIAFLIVFLSFLSMLASARLYGFQFVVSYDRPDTDIPLHSASPWPKRALKSPRRTLPTFFLP